METDRAVPDEKHTDSVTCGMSYRAEFIVDTSPSRSLISLTGQVEQGLSDGE